VIMHAEPYVNLPGTLQFRNVPDSSAMFGIKEDQISQFCSISPT